MDFNQENYQCDSFSLRAEMQFIFQQRTQQLNTPRLRTMAIRPICSQEKAKAFGVSARGSDPIRLLRWSSRNGDILTEMEKGRHPAWPGAQQSWVRW